MTKPFAITGANIIVGDKPLANHAVMVANGDITGIVPESKLAQGIDLVPLRGGTLLPGLIDLQVNGGGGVLFNNDPSLEAIETICAAHTTLGTCRLLVTLISSTAATTTAAIQAGIAATNKKVPGFLGLHLEGPHLSVEKKGAHSEAVLRPMQPDDVAQLCEAKKHLPNLMVTVAPEMIEPRYIEQLSAAGIIVSLGHSNAKFCDAMNAFNSGATCATHLYNAMSPLQHREPGLVGATLTHPLAYAGLIADGVHVHPAAIKTALSSKLGPGKLFIVSDAMATSGSEITQFELDGRTIMRNTGRLELSDGTLAGADIDLLSSITFLIDKVGVNQSSAIRMASAYPSECLGASATLGTIEIGHKANLLHIDEKRQRQAVWVDGVAQHISPQMNARH